MSSDLFSITRHKVPCQHIREYPKATAGEQETTQYLEVKQYVPLSNRIPSPGDVTIIAAHANGFPKELYEPLFEELLKDPQSNGFKIRGIWIADVAMQGQSGVLNERTMGNDPSWFDHPRDLLHMINIFRDQMPRPLIGIGHSMGGCQLITLALMHPRLLSKLILIDPAIDNYEELAEPNIARASTFRVDLWASKADAEKAFRKSKFYQKWDSRVFDRWMGFGIREVPTAVYPADSGKDSKAVTLSTTKHQEVFSFFRPNFQGRLASGEEVVNRETHADLDLSIGVHYPFYRPEPPIVLRMMPHLRPRVLFIFGGLSDVPTPKMQKHLMESTGLGIGGSGGAKDGAVSKHVFENLGHLMPMEDPEGCSNVISAWLGKELKVWAEKEARFREQWNKVPARGKMVVSEEWEERMGGPLRPPGPKL